MALPFHKLNLKKQFRYDQKVKPLSVIGLDTETNPAVNMAELLCAETGQYLHPYSFEDIARFALNTRKFRGKCFVFYNLQFDVQAILKFCHPDVWRDLWEVGESEVDGFTLELIPWKIFKIKSGKKTASFYDVAQFFEYMTLDSAAKRYLDDKKIDTVDRMNLDLKAQETIDYCIQDAKLAGDLARFMLTLHETHFPDSPQSLISKASVSEKHFLKTAKLPTINNVMDKKPAFVEMAYNSYKGGFFQAFKKGFFPQLYVYDINSAYPYHMARLPDISQGFFLKKKGAPLPDAAMGWMLAQVEVFDDQYGYFNPIAIDYKNTRFYPSGNYLTYLTLAEYDQLKAYFIIEPIEGVYWIPETDELNYPYKDELERLYKWKQKEKDYALKMYVKIVLNSIYGKTIQKVPNRKTNLFDTGNLFNPFYASYITANTRLQIFQLLTKMDKDDLVLIATDSIITKKKLPIDTDNELGGWGIEKDGKGVVIGSGVYSIEDKSDRSVITKNRGFRSTNKINFLNMDNLKCRDKVITLDVKNHFSMAKALISKDYDKMNLILQGTRQLNINFDYRRRWHNSFDNVEQLANISIDSSPLDFNLITNL